MEAQTLGLVPGPVGEHADPRAAGADPYKVKGAARPVPQRNSDFDHLTLDGLRCYRSALTAEEGKVSYWRRILQARLDVLREGRMASVDPEHLSSVLTDARVSSGRTALVGVMPVDDIPPLPDLAELWARQVDHDGAHSAESRTALEADLDAAETQLSTYRSALHVRIGAATGELIARYREQPTLCLSALPLPREQAASA